MPVPPRRIDRVLLAIAVAAAIGLGLAATTDRVRVGRNLRRRWSWPWLHWCMFDRECQSHGNPRRLYVHPAGLYVDFPRPEDRIWERLEELDA